MSEVRDSTVPCSECGGRHCDVLRLLDGAGHVVGQVVAGLHRLRELDHHHARQGVPVLAAWHISGVTQHRVLGLINTHCNTAILVVNL